MGACIRISSPGSDPSGTLLVSTSVDNPFGFNVLLINKSYLYYLLRKEIYNALKGASARQSEFIDLRSNKEFSQLHSCLAVNLTGQLEPSVKVLYDFRNLVLLDDESKQSNYVLKDRQLQLLGRLKELKVAPTAVLIYRWPIKDFLREFQFLAEVGQNAIERSLMAKFNLPFLLFSGDELLERSNKGRIFLHSEKMYERNNLLEPAFYKNYFQAHKTIDALCADTIEGMKEPSRVEQLRKRIRELRAEGGSIILLHRLNEQQDELVKLAMRHICDTFEVSYSQGLLYFSEKFPNLISKATEQEKQQVIYSEKQIRKSSIKPASKAQQLEKLLLKHYMECSRDSNKTSRAYSLCLLLIDNICKEDSDSFRQVKNTNKQLGEHLYKFNAGRQLLQSIGFFPQSGNIYRNDMEVKYLKGYRTDLEVAYRKYEDSIRQGKS